MSDSNDFRPLWRGSAAVSDITPKDDHGLYIVSFKGIPASRRTFEREALSLYALQANDDQLTFPIAWLDEQRPHPDWNTFVYILSNPIFVARDVRRVISSEGFRIYPPFLLTRKSASSCDLRGEKLPFGLNWIEGHHPLPMRGIGSVQLDIKLEGYEPLLGLRLDVRRGAIEKNKLVVDFLRVCRLHSSQWWLTSRVNPFDLGARRAAEVQDNFNPVDCTALEYSAGSWMALHTYNQLFGIERAITTQDWESIGVLCRDGFLSDPGVDLFFDALVEHAEAREDRAILHLFTSLEIIASRDLLMKGAKDISSYGLKLLRKSSLFKNTDHALLRYIFEDRNQVAHGRRPKNIGSKYSLAHAIDCCHVLLVRYMEICSSYGWDKALKLS